MSPPEIFEGHGNSFKFALDSARNNLVPLHARGRPYRLLGHTVKVSQPVIGSPDPDHHTVTIEVDVPVLPPVAPQQTSRRRPGMLRDKRYMRPRYRSLRRKY